MHCTVPSNVRCQIYSKQSAHLISSCRLTRRTLKKSSGGSSFIAVSSASCPCPISRYSTSKTALHRHTSRHVYHISQTSQDSLPSKSSWALYAMPVPNQHFIYSPAGNKHKQHITLCCAARAFFTQCTAMATCNAATSALHHARAHCTAAAHQPQPCSVPRAGMCHISHISQGAFSLQCSVSLAPCPGIPAGNQRTDLHLLCTHTTCAQLRSNRENLKPRRSDQPEKRERVCNLSWQPWPRTALITLILPLLIASLCTSLSPTDVLLSGSGCTA